MPDSEMIERVAKAIYEAKRLIEGVDSTWDEVKDRAARPDGYAYAKLSYAASTNAARAAIEAMMDDPTVNMIDAACAAWANLHPGYPGEKPEPTAGDVVVAVYRAILSEALSPSLKEQEEGN